MKYHCSVMIGLLYCTSWWWSLEVVKPQTIKATWRSLTCRMFSCQKKKKKRADVNIVSVILLFIGVGNTEYSQSLREVRRITFKGCCTLNVTVSVSVGYFHVLWFGVSGLYFLFYLGVLSSPCSPCPVPVRFPPLWLSTPLVFTWSLLLCLSSAECFHLSVCCMCLFSWCALIPACSLFAFLFNFFLNSAQCLYFRFFSHLIVFLAWYLFCLLPVTLSLFDKPVLCPVSAPGSNNLCSYCFWQRRWHLRPNTEAQSSCESMFGISWPAWNSFLWNVESSGENKVHLLKHRIQALF